MKDLADALLTAADTVTGVDRGVAALTSTPGAFAAGEVGVPGRLGRRLHAHFSAALTARADEAALTAAQLKELAAAVEATQDSYRSVDDAVADRIERSTP
jgi:uncharacterized protein YukE